MEGSKHTEPDPMARDTPLHPLAVGIKLGSLGSISVVIVPKIKTDLTLKRPSKAKKGQKVPEQRNCPEKAET